jgi:hypothetical protein
MPAKDTDDNYVTAHQYDRDEAAFEDEGAPDAAELPVSSPVLRATSKTSVSSASRVHGWQVSEVRMPVI